MTFRHSSQARKDALEIPPQVQEILTKITSRLQERPNDLITVEELEEIFGLRKEAAVGSGEQLELSPKATRVSLRPDFFRKDNGLNPVLEYIRNIFSSQPQVPPAPALPEAPGASKSKPAASQKRIEKLFSTRDTLPVIKGEITNIGYPAISEDRIAVEISAGGMGHLIYREGNNPWQRLFSTGDPPPCN